MAGTADNQEANARLIAAAPAMRARLELLEASMNAIRDAAKVNADDDREALDALVAIRGICDRVR